jgi:hypothetical protein
MPKFLKEGNLNLENPWTRRSPKPPIKILKFKAMEW